MFILVDVKKILNLKENKFIIVYNNIFRRKKK